MKKVRVVLGVIALCLCLCACGGSSDSAPAEYATEQMSDGYTNGSGGSIATDDVYMYESADMEESAEQPSYEDAMENRKLITTMDISVETGDMDTLISNMEARVFSLGGYIESSNHNNNASYDRTAYYTVRVPEERLTEFVNLIAEETNVVYRSMNVEDVTLQYVDMESRKAVLETEEQRLLEMLEAAETVEDMIYIESRLSEIQYEMESMESQLRTFDNQIAYSTVYLEIREVREYTIVEEEPETTWERMARGFIHSLEDVKKGSINFAVGFVSALPHLLVWAVIITILVLIVKRIIKFQKKKMEKRRANMPMQAPLYPPMMNSGMPVYVPGNPMYPPMNGMSCEDVKHQEQDTDMKNPVSSENTENSESVEASEAPVSEDVKSKE